MIATFFLRIDQIRVVVVVHFAILRLMFPFVGPRGGRGMRSKSERLQSSEHRNGILPCSRSTLRRKQKVLPSCCWAEFCAPERSAVAVGRATGHGDAPGASHFQHAERPKHFEQAVDFVDGAGDFNDQGFRDTSTTRPRKTLINSIRCGPVLLVGGNLDERQVALKHGTVGNVFGQQYIDQLFKAGLQPAAPVLVGVTQMVMRAIPRFPWGRR